MGIGAWAYGGWQRNRSARSWAVAAALSVLTLPFVLAEVNEFGPAEASASSGTLFEEIPYSPAALDEALNAGTPVFAYFTADWCVTCKVNERVAIKTEAAAATFKANGVTVMVGDWTNQNPDITEILIRYERAGVPMYLFFPPGASAAEGRLLPQILTPGIIEGAITDG